MPSDAPMIGEAVMQSRGSSSSYACTRPAAKAAANNKLLVPILIGEL